ncbi:MAG: UDP-N-acetylglucosamine 1-carboxyvinyltransferase, partial [Desulfofustis sp.]|nr:UDP-N-acetylglucosamine 1-carboxyvinyltransferase [Desulfofustis sp.]
MEKMIVEGGRPLEGEVTISGAKNAALPLIAATLLAPGVHVLKNVPDLRDTRTILSLISELGARWRREGSTLFIDCSSIAYAEVSYDLVKTMRASVLVLGPLLGRLGRAKVSLPGGCAIGERPINFHINGFERFGVTCHLERGYVEAVIDGRLQGAAVYFDIPSVTGTENILMAAVLATGTTVIRNAAREPEIGNLIDMLVGMGADIEGKGSSQLTVHGVERLQATETEIIPDRIETGTYLIAAAATGGLVVVQHCCPEHLPALLGKLMETGAQITTGEHSITLCLDPRDRHRLKAVDIKTMPYPGYPTDLQAQFMALMTLSSG